MDIEIRVVGNGYIVSPTMRESQRGTYTPSIDIKCFESFSSLVDWLKDNLTQFPVPPLT